MYTIIIIALITLFLTIRDEKINGYCSEFSEYFLRCLVNLFICIPISAFVACMIPSYYYIETKEYEIESLKDNNKVSGSFFLGSGQIEGKMVYAMYLKDGDGFIFHNVPTDKTKIQYSEEKPKIIKSFRVKENTFLNKFSLLLDNETYLIKIPRASILNNYELDAE